MAELNGYLFTKEEEKACAELIKKMRTKKEFTFDFSARVIIKAKTTKEAEDIFWRWQNDVVDYTLGEWGGNVDTLYVDNYILEEELL